MNNPIFEVIVGNIGTVYAGNNGARTCRRDSKERNSNGSI